MRPDPPDKTVGPEHPPARPLMDGYGFYFIFYLGFGRAAGFMILIGYPSDPPDH